jgi:hypothetical protein
MFPRIFQPFQNAQSPFIRDCLKNIFHLHSQLANCLCIASPQTFAALKYSITVPMEFTPIED